MKKNIIIGIISFLLVGLPLHAQSEVDSLKELLATTTTDLQEAEIAIQLAKRYLFSDAKASLRYAYLAYEAALRSGNIKAINNALLQIGNVYAYKQAYHTAIEYYRDILKNLKNCQCTSLESETAMFLGQTFSDIKQYDSALVYLNKAQALQESIPTDSIKKSPLLLFLSEAEINKNIYDSAHVYLYKALHWYQSSRDTSGIVSAMSYLADYYDHLGRYDKELQILKEIYDISAKAGYHSYLCRINQRLAQTSLKKHDPAQAIIYLRKNVSCLKTKNLPEIKAQHLRLLADYHAYIGNYEKAIDYMEQLKSYTDSLQQEQLANIKDLFGIRYDMETKIKSLSLLKRDNQIRELNYRKNIFFKNVSFLALIFVVIIFVILFYLYLVSKRSHKQLLETNKKLEAVHEKLAQKQQQQQQENQIRNKLFMILAHDLINPFNALLGFAELLSEEIHNFERKDIKRHSEFIFQAAKQLHFLLENLLQWARIQTGRVQFQPAYIDMNKTIRDITDVYRYSAEKKKITFVVETSNDLIVYADEILITVVLRNLIHNAIKFTEELGVITVKASRHDNKVTVEVIDTGCGISDEDKKKLFNLEYHFTSKGTSGEEGTGLGLIICKEFLAFHSAELTVESTSGKGSRFAFSLPVKNKSNQP